MYKNKLRGFLALLIAFESLAPACWAADRSSDDALGDSFRNLQKFARAPKGAAVIRDVETPSPEETPRKRARADDRLAVETEIKMIDSYGLNKKILGAEQGEFLRFVSGIILAHGEVHHGTEIVLTDEEWSHPSQRYAEQRFVRELNIPIRALAAARNLDELAAILIRAIGGTRVYSHRDDPRIMRRLEEQISFSALPEADMNTILTDFAVIERLRGAGLRPWALTDFDRREGDNSFSSRMYELRLGAQKIAVAYMQDRENIRDLVRTIHPLPPALSKIRARALRHEPIRYAKQVTKNFAKKHKRLLYGATAGVAAGTAIQVPQVVDVIWHPELVTTAAASAGYGSLNVMSTLLDGAVTALGFAGHWLYVACSYLATWIASAAVFTFDWALSPFWTHVLGPILHVVGRVLQFVFVDVLWPVAKWTTWTAYDWMYYLFGAAGVGLLYRAWPSIRYLGRVVAEIGGTAFTKADDYRDAGQQALLGEFNRVWLRDVFSRDLIPTKAGLSEVEILARAARDLEVIRRNRTYFARNFETGERQFQPERDLSILGSVYRTPRDYMTLATEFWRHFTEAVTEGRLRASEIVSIGRPLLPNHSSDRAFDSVLGDLFLDREQRPRIAEFHREVRRLFPVPANSLVGQRAWGYDLVEYNDTSLPDAAFLGFTRIAAELEDAHVNPTARGLYSLWRFLNDRTRHPELIDGVVRDSFGFVTKKIFDGEWSEDDANTIFELYDEVRGQRRRNRYDDNWDQWAALPGRLADLRARALLAGEIGKAAAITTWASAAERPQNFTQVPSLLERVSNKALRGLTHDITDVWFTQRLLSLGSVHAITEWIDRDVVARGARLKTLTPVLYSFVLDHPETIKDMKDIEALNAHDYFWPLRPIRNLGFLALAKDTVNAGLRHHKALDEELHDALEKARDKNKVNYLTNLCEKMHRLIVERMGALGLKPTDYDGLENFWLELTNRAVTSETDRLMQELIEKVSPDRLPKLRRLAVADRRVWERDLHSRLALSNARSKASYRKLLAMSAQDQKRPQVLDRVIEELQEDLPERGLAYVQFLEDLSVQLNSTYAEAKRISVAKGEVKDTTVTDSNLQAIRTVFRAICGWSKAEQFNFLKFLRGEAKPSARLVAAFPSVGLERVARMYEILPVGARVGILDSMLTHGLLKHGEDARGWTEKLSRHIVGGQKTDAQVVTLQLLTAFLYAIEQIGNEQMTTTILSYLYALPPASTTDPVEVLKLVLELFGATGIKVGQFTYATQILGEAGEKLHTLQSRARVPDRIEIYEDVYDLLGVPVGTPLPFLVLELLGAASMKYAFMGLDRENLQKVVVKVFRLDAMNNVDLQFDALEHMGKFLVENYGPRYGVFKVIIQTARTAVRREGSMPNEIRRSRLARNHIYANRSTETMRVEAPREDLVNPRMIVAQYAPGVPFPELPAAEKPVFAKTLLELENDILFADARVVRFDPDRHAGNAQMDALAEIRALHPIDFGQVLRLTRAQRMRIVKLFALAQIASRVGASPWVLREFRNLLELSPEQVFNLRTELPRHLKVSTKNAISYYISTLAALDQAGFEITETTYVDLVRAIIQLKPFEKYAPEANSPRKTFTKMVFAEVGEFLKTFEYDAALKGKVRAYNGWLQTKRFFTGEEIDLVPTDPREITLKLVKQLEHDVNCERGLGESSADAG